MDNRIDDQKTAIDYILMALALIALMLLIIAGWHVLDGLVCGGPCNG